MPTQRLVQLSLIIREYDEALAFFVGKLGFDLLEDTDMGNAKRWVRIRPPGGSNHDPALLLARAATAEQLTRVGNQTGGRVFLFLHTDDIARDYAALTARGIRFRAAPRAEPYGTVAVFEDLYGNAWDLIQPRQTSVATPRSEPAE